MTIGIPNKQKGAAAIEFGLVFVIFFMVLYGVLSYSLPLLLMQSFNHSATEAARRSVAVDPAAGSELAYQKAVQDTAQSVLTEQLKWVPTALSAEIVKEAEYSLDTRVLTVRVSVPAVALATILPVLKLGAITVPDLPESLEAVSTLQMQPLPSPKS